MILVIFAEVVISSIPHSRTRRHKKLHSNRPPNAQRLLLKVNNFSRTHLQLNTPTNRRTVRLWSRNGFYLQVSKNLTPIGNRTPNARGNTFITSIFFFRNEKHAFNRLQLIIVNFLVSSSFYYHYKSITITILIIMIVDISMEPSNNGHRGD